MEPELIKMKKEQHYLYSEYQRIISSQEGMDKTSTAYHNYKKREKELEILMNAKQDEMDTYIREHTPISEQPLYLEKKMLKQIQLENLRDIQQDLWQINGLYATSNPEALKTNQEIILCELDLSKSLKKIDQVITIIKDHEDG